MRPARSKSNTRRIANVWKFIRQVPFYAALWWKSPSCRAARRSFGLHVLSFLPYSRAEEPCVILDKSLVKALARCTVHMVPVLCEIVLIWVNLYGVLYGTATQFRLAVMQVAAKTMASNYLGAAVFDHADDVCVGTVGCRVPSNYCMASHPLKSPPFVWCPIRLIRRWRKLHIPRTICAGHLYDRRIDQFHSDQLVLVASVCILIAPHVMASLLCSCDCVDLWSIGIGNEPCDCRIVGSNRMGKKRAN